MVRKFAILPLHKPPLATLCSITHEQSKLPTGTGLSTNYTKVSNLQQLINT